MVELPRWDALPGDEARCRGAIDCWVNALLDSGVVEAFSGQDAMSAFDRTLPPETLLDAIDVFAAQHWDFRAGRERNLAADPNLSVEQERIIADAASHLGLNGTLPPRRASYDAVLMTGGMVRAGIVKPRFLRELTDSGLGWRDGVFLGAFRPFAGDEIGLAPLLGVDGDNEFDAMAAGMRGAFDLGSPDRIDASSALEADMSPSESERSRWREECWGWNGRTLRVIAAPSSDPVHRRANTADTYRFWAARAHDIRSVLIVTTPVYVPYQGAGAVEVLGLDFGLAVETVAVSVASSDLGALSQEFLARHRVQELRSAVHGMRSLRRMLDRL